MVSEAIASGAWLMVIAALAIPILSAVTQWLNVKLMPQADTERTTKRRTNDVFHEDDEQHHAYHVRSILLYAAAGMGLYWIAGSVVRSVQQVAINKHIDRWI